METELDMNAAIDAAAEIAEPEGIGEPIADEPDPQDAPDEAETETETPDEEPEAVADDAETVDDGDLASRLADLTRDELLQTGPGKGLYAENKRLRDQLRELKAGKTEPEAEPDDDEEPWTHTKAPDSDEFDLDGMDDDDLVEARHVKSLVAKMIRPLQERIGQSAKADRQQIMATGLAALRADKGVPAGVNPSSIVNDAISALGETRPVLLKELLSEPDPVRAVWEYATARMPAAKQALAKAMKTKADVQAERLARGRSPDTGDEPDEVVDLVADLNTAFE